MSDKGIKQEFWESRVSDSQRYEGVGISSLPNQINKYRRQIVFQQLDKIIPQNNINFNGLKVLDAGCGTGIFSQYYADRGADVFGIDISNSAIATINELGISGDYRQGQIDDLPFQKEKFDLIHCFSVFYHIMDDEIWENSVDEMDRVLKQGGLMNLRIAWRENSARLSDHVKHRSRNKYMSKYTSDMNYRLEGTYPLKDDLRYHKALVAINRITPNIMNRTISYIYNNINLYEECENQKIVLFRKDSS